MKTYLDCYPCFLRQALSAARRAGASEVQQHQILLATMEQLSTLSLTAAPPDMADAIHRLVRCETQLPDPYRQAKQEATQQALDLLPRLRAAIRTAPDPLETAARIAIAGNIIDLGMAETYELEATLDRALEEPLAVNGLATFRRALEATDAILYLGDNAGETVFDRALIEILPHAVTYAVKGGPAINDATREDARAAGLEAIAEIIDNGWDAPGTPLDRCADSFRQRFARAPLIVAKGQANYESLSEVSAPLVFLLQAKCSVIARDLGVPTGSFVLKVAPQLADSFPAR